MIIMKLSGGLGNQMFQYALARNISEIRNEKIILDISSYKKDKLREYSLDIFKLNNDIVITTKYGFLIKLLKKFKIKFKKICFENYPMEFNRKLINSDCKVNILDGYFQNYSYFEDIKETLKGEFSIKKSLNFEAQKILLEIRDNESVCIHIRRGDYIFDENAKKNNGICGLEYYNLAINYILKTKQDSKFYIFSDDIKWVKENIIVENCVYVDSKISKNDFEDFELMKNCKNFIIANSTFSWWAAWLSNNDNKTVLAPKQWFVNNEKNKKTNGLIPKEWIRL